MAKDQDNDQQIDILGDSADITNNSQDLINQNIALLSQLNYNQSQTPPLPTLSHSAQSQSILPMLALAKSSASSQATNIPPNVVVLPNQVRSLANTASGGSRGYYITNSASGGRGVAEVITLQTLLVGVGV